MLSFAITKGDKDDANDIILNDDPLLTTSLVYTLITIFRMPFFFPFNPLEWAASKRYTKNAYKIPSINVDALKTPLHQIGGVETSVSFILFFLGGSIWALNKFPTIFLNLQRLVCLHFGLWLYHTHIVFLLFFDAIHNWNLYSSEFSDHSRAFLDFSCAKSFCQTLANLAVEINIFSHGVRSTQMKTFRPLEKKSDTHTQTQNGLFGGQFKK